MPVAIFFCFFCLFLVYVGARERFRGGCLFAPPFKIFFKYVFSFFFFPFFFFLSFFFFFFFFLFLFFLLFLVLSEFFAYFKVTKTDTNCHSKCVCCTRGVCGAIFENRQKKGIFLIFSSRKCLSQFSFVFLPFGCTRAPVSDSGVAAFAALFFFFSCFFFFFSFSFSCFFFSWV